MVSNGVCHSTNFFAIMATTRNPEPDELTRGASFGAEPLKNDIKKVKLRFGPLLKTTHSEDNSGQQIRESEKMPHTVFGVEGSVGRLKKG